MAIDENKTAPKVELQEIASVARDITRSDVFGGILTNNDETLIARGGGKGLKIYDELERDCHAYAVLQKRKLAVVARPWEVDAASDRPLDQQAAALVREVLDDLPFDRICEDLLDATLKGFSVGEVMWQIRRSRTLGRDMIAPGDVIAREQRRFTFDIDKRLRMLTRAAPLQGEELPERKFIVHRFGAKDGNPYGRGLGTRLFWPVFFKRQDLKFWLTFADKFGSPTAVGKYPNGAPKPDQDKLLEILRKISNDAGVVIPEGMLIEFLEAQRSGSTDAYEKLVRYLDEQISEAVLGETMSTTARSTGLGSNQATIHNEVRLELAQADADLLSATLNISLVRWLVDYNLPGADYPLVWRNFEEAEDLKVRADRDKVLYEMGFEPDEEYIQQTYGPGWRRRPPMPPPGVVVPAGGPVPGWAQREPAFAEEPAGQHQVNRDDQQDLAEASEALAEKWQTLIGPRVEELQTLLEQTKDLRLFRERLDEILLSEPPAELVEALARAGFAAQLRGRVAKA